MKVQVGHKLNDVIDIDVSIDESVDKIAVLFSGGMDSTLVLWMLLKDREIKNLNTEIHCFTASQPGRKYHSQKILSLPDFTNKVIHHPDAPNDAPEGITPLVLDLLEKNWTIYSGANRNPIENIGGRYPPRKFPNPLPQNFHLVFRHLFKYHILEAYFKLEVQHLIPFTSSCTELEIGSCGVCFACLERKWASDKLGIYPAL